MEEKLEVISIEETPLSNGQTLTELAKKYNECENLYIQDKVLSSFGKVLMCAGAGIAILGGTILGLTKGANQASLAALGGVLLAAFGFVMDAQFGKWLELDRSCYEGAKSRYQ